LLHLGAVVDNRTLCDLTGVGVVGGIRVDRTGSKIVLVNNNTDPTYRNEWRGDVLHFVGRGAVGPQVLSGQNKTLANSGKYGWTVHLFEVHEKSRYTYVGEVELAGEPYLSEQQDARAQNRFVWIFPLRKKEPAAAQFEQQAADYLPHGAYAVISDVDEGHHELVNEALDKLRQAGVKVFDRRDVDRCRYDKALAIWWQAVLDRVRTEIRKLIASRKRAAKAAGRDFAIVDDELRVNSASTEAELRAALSMLDYDGVAQEQLFEEATQAIPMPDAPASLREPIPDDQEMPTLRTKGRRDFSDFT
jgi:hypothetical protein